MVFDAKDILGVMCMVTAASAQACSICERAGVNVVGSSDTASGSDDDDGSDTAMIVGGVVGGLALIGGVIGIVACSQGWCNRSSDDSGYGSGSRVQEQISEAGTLLKTATLHRPHV